MFTLSLRQRRSQICQTDAAAVLLTSYFVNLLFFTSFPDICTLGHDNKCDLVEELLALMARDGHSPEVGQISHFFLLLNFLPFGDSESLMATLATDLCVLCLCLQVQESFAACALDIMKVYDENRGRHRLEWSNSSLSHVASLLLRANKTQHAW